MCPVITRNQPKYSWLADPSLAGPASHGVSRYEPGRANAYSLLLAPQVPPVQMNGG